MYIPDIYKNECQSEIEEFIHENGFAILINQADGKFWGTHVPLFLEKVEGKSILSGHIAKANPQALNFKEEQEVLVIFNGPHSYISSSWYDHENVPTWNYLAVHVYGKLRPLNHEQTIKSLKKLVDKYEQKQEKPIRVEDLSSRTMREALGVFAFEIEISEIQAQKKLSQNRDDKNYNNIIHHLEKSEDSNDQKVAFEMRKNRTNL
ncbi:FMN-binding negative transcriptional regulator [Flavobacterium luminosum]|uniref:FMN-binding negative transcriptional regulator n=1 Tax=Flavobacterium luminosum TaxID=2949086 RepID=A0ABT0TKC3_9FLAO|nr:FMN-binding negative transcriptional regulator [Flavobacterium sp. HXWNR70]MCL9807780.1 FMN-binding negative transcriptional regulator [Flavobacterium sp. HXWNR70]